MRRPLFGNGIPQLVGPLTALSTVFDAAAFSDQAVFAVTLYVWWVQNGSAVPFSAPSLSLFNFIAGAPSVPPNITGADGTYLDALWASPALSKPPAPFKILDRFMVRGDQSVKIASDDTESQVWMWGYFESVGEQESPRPFRGLQPAPLAAPFAYPPTLLAAGASEDLTAVVHTLVPNYIDLVTLDIQTLYAGATTGLSRPYVTMPGGVQIQMSASSLPAVRLFDGIPMKAPSAADASIGIRITTAPLASGIIGAYGGFDRG